MPLSLHKTFATLEIIPGPLSTRQCAGAPEDRRQLVEHRHDVLAAEVPCYLGR